MTVGNLFVRDVRRISLRDVVRCEIFYSKILHEVSDVVGVR